MKTLKRLSDKLLAAVTVVGLLLGAASALVSAQSGGGFDLSWSTVDGGGGASAGGSFRLTGTIGQPDAGRVSGGSYRLDGGFWSGGAAAGKHVIYIPLVLKDI